MTELARTCDHRLHFPTIGQWLEECHANVLVADGPVGRTPARMFRLRQQGAFSDPASPDLTVQLVVRGSLNFRGDFGFGDIRDVARPGTFVVTPPHRVLNMHSNSVSFELLTLTVPWSHLDADVQEATGGGRADLGTVVHGRQHHGPRVPELMHMLWREASQNSPAGALAAGGLLMALTAQLARLAESPVTPSNRSLRPAVLRRVLDRMRRDLHQDLSLADLAAEAGVSRYHFGRLFRSAVGEPPWQHLTRLRVEKAQELLREQPELTVAAIAQACGFADQSHLSRRFRRLVGTTPARWRDDQVLDLSSTTA